MLFTAIAIYSSCTNNIEKITIQPFPIDTILIERNTLPDSLLISDISLRPANYSYNKKEKELIVESVEPVGSINISEPIGDSIIDNPNFKFIEFLNPGIKNPNSEKYAISKNVEIVIKRPNIKVVLINQLKGDYDPNVLPLEILDSLYQKTVLEVQNIKDSINNIIKNSPDHSFKALMGSKYFAEIDKTFDDIFSYINAKDHSPEITKQKIRKLLEIEIDLSSLRQEFNNPYVAPTSFGGDILFKSGEYLISMDQNLITLNGYLESMINEINSKKAEELNIYLEVVGYTDDQDIGFPLNEELIDLYRNPRCNLSDQNCLNILLSEQRALNVKNYLINQLNKNFKNTNIKLNFSESQFIGRGKIYPSNMQYESCPGDCQQRRIVNIARLIIEPYSSQ